MMQQIMDMVDPSEEVEHSLCHQLKDFLGKQVTLNNVDTTIENLLVGSIQGKKFYDPELTEDKLFTKMSLRAANKKTAKEILGRVRKFK